MRKLLVMVFLSTVPAYGQTLRPYEPLVQGAQGSVVVAVNDEEGRLVPDADIHVWFEISDVGSTLVKGKSYTNGKFLAKCDKFIGTVHLQVEKSGYYPSKMKEFIGRRPMEDVIKTRTWSEGPVAIPVTLKKIRRPAHLICRGERYDWLNYPATNAVMGFDLKMRDWCPPYGKGEYDDWQVRYEFDRSPDDWSAFHERLVVTMTNALDGVCFRPVDAFSDFKYAYQADANAVYEKRFEVDNDRRDPRHPRSVTLPKDSFIVFRTRTRTDDEGRLVSAHYGYVPESFRPYIFFDIVTLFNPVANDTNLESTPEASARATGKGSLR